MEIPQIKQQLSILDVAGRLGIKLDKHHKAHCPFHDDKTPSLQFSKEKDIAQKVAEHASLRSEDVAEAVTFMLSRPPHVTIRDLVMLPQQQDL